MRFSPASKSNHSRRRLREELRKPRVRIVHDHRVSRKLCLFLDPGERRAYQLAGTRTCKPLGTPHSAATTLLGRLFQPSSRPNFRDPAIPANQMGLLKTLYTAVLSWTRVGEESRVCKPNGSVISDALDHFILMVTGGSICDSGLIHFCLRQFQRSGWP